MGRCAAPDSQPRPIQRCGDAIDCIIARSHTAESGIVWRCVDMADGRVFDDGDASYMSTSLSSAYLWEHYGKKAKSPMIVKIYLPKCSKGVYISHFTKDNPDKQEAEFLLQRGTLLRNVSKTEHELDGRMVREICVLAVQPASPSDLRQPPPNPFGVKR